MRALYSLSVASALIAVTWFVFAGVRHFDFVEFDDPDYVLENEQVLQGVSREGLAWAFTTDRASTWQPLTWLSFMLDVELQGPRAAGFHTTNLLLHLLNVLLLFVALLRLTGSVGPSGVVAALFALHPLHVEPVAWITARKDLLSTAFGWASLALYASYARRGGAGRYAACAAALTLGLMAKPMLVTWPCLFLLLDAWPLARLRSRSALPRLALEKLPFLALAAAVSAVTLAVQQVAPARVLPLSDRLANALVSYARYLYKTLWPRDLSVLYPHPYYTGSGAEPWTGWQVAAALLLLLAVSALVALSRRGYARVGWLWFLGTLVPAIGLVQIGNHAMADRFSYVPLVGLFLMLAWAAAELWEARPRLRPVAAAVAVTALVACAAASRMQIRYWRGSIPLFERALEVDPDNSVMLFALGSALQVRGRLPEAIEKYRRALEIWPEYADAHANLGNAFTSQRKLRRAIRHYRLAIASDPQHVVAHYNLANALRLSGDVEGAAGHYGEVLRLEPDHARARAYLGRVQRWLERGAPAP